MEEVYEFTLSEIELTVRDIYDVRNGNMANVAPGETVEELESYLADLKMIQSIARPYIEFGTVN